MGVENMNGVVDPIQVESVPGTDKWKLLLSFEWHGIIVPEGFVTDFASIPSLVKFYLNPVGKIKPASLVHDWLYNLRGRLRDPIVRDGKVKHSLTRAECDKEFLNIMKLLGMRWDKRWAAYLGVRSGGWVFWNKKKKGA